MRRYLALFLPRLSAERAIRANAARREASFALIEAVHGVVRVTGVSVETDNGLIGLTLADARARVPSLVVVPHNHVADAALLDWVADGCEIYSPTVAIDPPTGILIDMTGCPGDADEPLFAAKVTARLASHGLTASVAFGSTPDAAAALAQFPATTLATLPLTALRIDGELHVALQRTGLTTVGALAACPRAPLAARFGAIIPTMLARLLGEEDVRLVPRRLPPTILHEHRFADPIMLIEVIQTALDRLMASACEQLALCDLGGRRFEVTLFRSDGHVARLTFETGRPTRDPTVLGRLLTERIASLADPLDPGFGYDLIRFAVLSADYLGTDQLVLDGEINPELELATLIDRLTTRLGSGRVRRLSRGHSHLPERAAFDAPVTSEPSSWPAPEVGEPPSHPLHLFTPPQPIEVLAEVPDGPPRRFQWRQRRHDIFKAEGPERIAAEWWQRRDGGGLTRDYYRLEDSDGRRFWVFRHGLYGVEHNSPRWYLHGLFP